jgi:DNA mismatch repair protein MutS
VRRELGSTYDLERLLSRLTLGAGNPRDLLALRRTFETLPEIHRSLRDMKSPRMAGLAGQLDPLDDLRTRIQDAISDEAPANLSTPGIIRSGYNPELDRHRLAQGALQQRVRILHRGLQT